MSNNEYDKIKLADIMPSEYNPRKITDTEYAKLTNSISEFGLVDPIIINLKNNRIIGGHQRYKVLLDKHSSEIDEYSELNLIRLGDIGWVFPDPNLSIKSEEIEKALNIALNQNNLMGGWDNEKLKSLFHDLNETDIKLDITGFDDFEIDLFLDDEYETFNYQYIIDEEEEQTEEKVEDKTITEDNYDEEEDDIGGDILSSIEHHNSTNVPEPEIEPISKIDKLQKQQQEQIEDNTPEDTSQDIPLQQEEQIDYADVIPDDYVEVKGDNANKSYVVSIGFDTHEIANKFLEYINYHRRIKRDTLQFMFTELNWDMDQLLLEKQDKDKTIEEQAILFEEENSTPIWESINIK